MRGYSRNQEIDENLDEYEEDGDDQEEEEAEEEYEEEEDPKPTKEEMEYLELRQRLKEDLRKQMKKECGASVSDSQDKKKKLPYDNYGSFFGPSQPVIAQRVIQESKSLLENQHLAARVLNSHQSSKKSPASTTTGTRPGPASTTTGTRPGMRDPPPKVVNEVKLKVQKLKDMRDYSFLWSDDAELPAPTKEPPPRNVSVRNSDARPAQVQHKSKQSTSNPSRPVSNGRDERKPVPTNRQLQTKAVLHQVAPASRPKLALADPRKQLGSNTGNGPGRPVGQKGLPSKLQAPTKMPTSNKMPAPTMDKKSSLVGVKRSVPGVQKAPLSKLNSSAHKQHPEHKRELRELDKAKPMSKQPVSSSKPQIKPPKQIPSHTPMQMNRPKKRPIRQYSDEEEDDDGPGAISIIRKMFGYNPKKFAGVDEDDSDMEANFDDILEEEKLSAKIAREEDERELRLIEEEERRERLRKEAKKRKLSQR